MPSSVPAVAMMTSMRERDLAPTPVPSAVQPRSSSAPDEGAGAGEGKGADEKEG